ncbi:MAG: DUF5123 domain-containing protein [Bacteroides sp.]|nr:DUF5123 domain-containing protein [Bacteroides sp.]
MKNYILDPIKLLLLIAGFSFVFAACSDDDDGNVVPNRLFRPLFVTDSIYAHNNSLHIVWYDIKDARGYLAEISLDDFTTVLESVETTGTVADFRGLEWETAYGIRVKALHEDPAEDSHYAVFEGGLSTEMKPVINMGRPLVDLSPTSTVIAWDDYQMGDKLYVVSKLLVYEDGTLISTITTGLGNKRYELTGLTPDTEYTVVLGVEDEMMGQIGSITFTTYRADIIIVGEGEDLYTLIKSAPQGSTFLLPAGLTHAMTTTGNVPMEYSFTLIGGETGDDSKVGFYVDGEFEPVAGGNVDHMRFRNLEINGFGDTDGDYQTGMFIADGGNDFTLGTLEFTDCDIKHAQWAFVYLKGTNQVINEVIIENCTLTDLGSQWGQEAPICGAEAANSGYNSVTMRNSTLTDCPAGVVTSNRDATGSITIENCTFYNTMRAPFMLINYKTYTVAGTITIQNNLFGENYITRGPEYSTRGAVVNDAALAQSPFISDNYATTDFTMEEYPIPGMGSAGGDSEAVFQDAPNGDLTIIGNTMKRLRAGDPRWY